jgi:TrmH family RNA methyltransferase
MISKLSLNKQTYIRKLKQKKFRYLEQTFICEGFRLFEAAIHSQYTDIQDIVIAESISGSQQEQFILSESSRLSVPVYRTEDKSLKSLSQEVSPPGILFTVKKKLLSLNELSIGQGRILLYLDQVSDPGNLGTIIRTAVWFGHDNIILSPGCVDPLNAKSVRASAGAVFNVNLYIDIKFEWIKDLLKNENYEFIATASGKGRALDQWKVGKKSIIFFGQEASGLTREILESADKIIQIQRRGQGESLNLSVAVGIILHYCSF